MNFFFGLNYEFISSEINIPKFNFLNKKIFSNYKVYKAIPNQDFWNIESLNYSENESFFFISNEQIDNNSIFFLANSNEIKNIFFNNKFQNLINFNNLTDNEPVEFRANLKLSLRNGGYSSYQSEYNYFMTKKKGSILSPLNLLFNIEADRNLFIFRNIFFKPEINKYKIYLISLKQNKILQHYDIYSNTTNIIEIDKKFIKEDVFFFTDKIIGIPLYLSLKDNHLSLEHTHPPHHYILSEDKFKIVNRMKNKFKEIVDEQIIKK